MNKATFEMKLLLLGWVNSYRFTWEKNDFILDTSASWNIYLHLTDSTYISIGPRDEAMEYLNDSKI